MDTDRRELHRGGVVVRVEPQVFDLLQHLIRHRERVVSKDELLAEVWHGRIVSEATLSSRINAARSALGDNGEQQRLIRTVPRKGFRFIGGVREQERGAATFEPAQLEAPDRAKETTFTTASPERALGAVVDQAGERGSWDDHPCNDHAARLLVQFLRHVENKVRVWPGLINRGYAVSIDNGVIIAEVVCGAGVGGDEFHGLAPCVC
ncbi:MAG TPA: transcriptional regulator [Steroidobacteraceae bacterium]|nr:transcriptional regulator [Steroidobacteraceae bacterium]